MNQQTNISSMISKQNVINSPIEITMKKDFDEDKKIQIIHNNRNHSNTTMSKKCDDKIMKALSEIANTRYASDRTTRLINEPITRESLRSLNENEVQIHVKVPVVMRESDIEKDNSLKLVQKLLSVDLQNLTSQYKVEMALVDLSIQLGSVLSTTARRNCEVFTSLRGHELVVRAMAKWITRGCENLQSTGCYILRITLMKDIHITMKGQDAVGTIKTVDAIQTIVDAMKLFPTDRSVQRNGCGALYAVIHHSKYNTGMRTPLELDMLNAVTTSMTSFRQDDELLKWGCNIVWFSMRHGEFKDELLDSGMLQLLTVVLESSNEHHTFSKQIRQRVRSTIAHLLHVQTIRRCYPKHRTATATLYPSMQDNYGIF
jgi:hypothetical protein